MQNYLLIVAAALLLADEFKSLSAPLRPGGHM